MIKTCSIIGHREINITEKLKETIKKVVLHLIKDKNVLTFLFGSKGQFNSLCYDIITEIKVDYPESRRIYIRAEYPFISKDYYDYLLEFYEDSIYFDKNGNSSRLNYIKRNEYLINHSQYCLFYFDNNYTPKTKTKSGTAITYYYAIKNNKEIINIKNGLVF